MSNIEYVSNAKKIYCKSVCVLIVQILLILLIIVTCISSLIKSIDIEISVLLILFALLMSWLIYFRLELVIKIKHRCNIIKNGEIEYGVLKSVLLQPCRHGWITKFVYSVKINDNIIFYKDTCHCIEEDYGILKLDFHCGDVVVPENCLIPIVKYKKSCIVLFHQCGFYDAIVRNSMSMYDLFPC